MWIYVVWNRRLSNELHVSLIYFLRVFILYILSLRLILLIDYTLHHMFSRYKISK